MEKKKQKRITHGENGKVGAGILCELLLQYIPVGD